MGDTKKNSTSNSTGNSKRNKKEENKKAKKEVEKSSEEIEEEEEEDDDDDERQVKHCICESRDYTTLMICCDYCLVWYHVECVKVSKSEVKQIRKYACGICTKKNPQAITKYKKGTKLEKEETAKQRKTKSKEKDVEEPVKKNSTGKKEKKPINQKETKRTEKHTERNDGSACKTSNSWENVKKEPKEEPKEFEELKPKIEPVTVSTTESHVLSSITIQQKQQLELQEANPELRCKNCIGCFREKDCGKCFTCVQNEGKCCMDRVCVQVEELLKQKFREKIKPMELVVDEEISLKIEVESPEVGQQKSKKGRKPKHLALKTGETKQEKKRRAQHSGEDMNAHLNRVYCNWMKRQGKGSARPTNKEEDVQCHGLGCTNSARIDSKYCSEACGMALAEQRLRLILPQRFNSFFETEPSSQTSDKQRHQQLEEQIDTVKNKLDELEQWKDNVHQFVVALKNAHPSAQKQPNDEESMVVGCPVCQGEYAMREIGKHIQSCFVRSERQTTYGTDYQIPNNQFNLYCDTFNKINKTYCKRLRYACSEHYKDEYTHKVCGCPLKWYSGGSFRFHELFLSSDAIMADEGFCQEKQKSCMDHKNWVQTAFSMIDNERLNLLNKLEELFEQQRILYGALSQRGTILALLCNSSTKET